MRERYGQRIFDVVRSAIVTAIVVAGVAAPTGRAAAQTPPPNIVANGGFESPAVINTSSFDTKLAGSTKLTSWTIGGHSIDHIKGYWLAAEGSQSLDLDGTGPGSISQTLTTAAGKNYVLSFKWSANPDRAGFVPKMTVKWGSTLTEQFTFSGTSLRTNMSWQTVTRTVTAATNSTVLSFTSNDPSGSSYGVAIDDVRVTVLTDQATLTVTGPSSLTYLATGTYSTTGGNGTGAVTFVASTGCTVTASTTSPATVTVRADTGTGTCSVTATKAADGTYNAKTSAAFPVALAKANQLAVTVAGPSSLTYGTTGTIIASGGSGSGTVSFSAGASTGCSVGATTGTVSVTNASGTCAITATKAADANYNAAPSAPLTVTLAKASAVAPTVAGPASLTYGTTGTVTSSGGSSTGAVSFGASGGCTVGASTGIVSPTTGTGTCLITATKAADANYNVATSAPFTVTLAKASQATLTVSVSPSPLTFGTTGTASTSGGNGGGDVTYDAGASTGCSVNGTAVTVIDAGANISCTLVATKAGDSNFNSTISAPFVVGLPSPFAAPVLIRAVATGNTSVYIIGRIDGAAGIQSTLQVYVASTCTNSRLDSGAAVGSPISVTPDANGNFGTQLASGVTSGNFVAIQVTSPDQTEMSACLASSGDNETWPKALQLSGAAPTTALTAGDYIDTPGKVRWYKFDVLPGQRITVSLSNLPADYDLALFKDIGATFVKLLNGATTKDELTRASAEFAPTVYAPGAFAPGAFAPGAFAPGAFAPGAFAPGAFAPGAFAPGAFAPGAFAPGAFAPGAFAPGAFAPGAFAPGAFAPGAFAPGAFAPGAFAPGAFAPTGVPLDDLSKAYSSAQTRSIIGVSATAGVGDELVVANSWNNTGSFYVRVIGRGGASSTGSQFQVNISRGETSCVNVIDPKVAVPNTTGLIWDARGPAAGASLKTVILTDSVGVAPVVSDRTMLLGKLDALRVRSEVSGTIVDVAGDARVQWLKTQAAANPFCPYAMNLVAEEIKGIVDSYRANNPGLRYVVIAGNDDAVAFFRYPDQSRLGEEANYVPPVKPDSASEASLRLNYMLSQDAYGAGTRISLRSSDYPVPGLAVGRLVETPAEIAGMIDAYVATGGVVAPGSSLVTGYDFLADAAHKVSYELGQGTNASPEELITEAIYSPLEPQSWHADDLATKLFSNRHDVIFLAGHFSANSALAADFSTNLLTTDLAASTTDFANSIVYGAGCHFGYNLMDAASIDGVTQPLDWVQAFAQKKATLIAGTGYQYGDTDFIEYSERLYLNFSRQLRADVPNPSPDGIGVVRIGEALVKAKIDYLAATPDIRGIHEKALLEATLFGLPMLGVNMPGARIPVAGLGTGITPQLVGTAPGSTLGLKTADLSIAQTLTPVDVPLTIVGPSGGAIGAITASYLPGPDGVVSNPIEPTLPLVVRNVTPTDSNLVLRGVGFRGGAYSNTNNVVALTSAATTEIRGVHVSFGSSLFYPMRPWSINYWGGLAGTGATSLLVTPAQHRSVDIAQALSTRRAYSNMDLRLYYSGKLGKAALSDALSIVSVNAVQSGNGVDFTAQIVGDPDTAIYEAWITLTSGNGPTGTWEPLDLIQCGTPAGAGVCGTTQDSSIWKARKDFGSNPVPADIQYTVQAASGYGLVTFDDNRGLYYRLAGAVQAATSLTFTSAPPTTKKFGDDLTVNVKLASANSAPLANKSVTVTVGGVTGSKTTETDGTATITLPLVTVPGSYSVGASFAGDGNFLASATSATIPIQVNPATTTLTMLTPTLASPAVGATLKVTLGNTDYPLLHESVKFTLTGGAVPKDIYVITDFLGQALLPSTGLPAGSYTLSASFAGNGTYSNATSGGGQGLTIVQQIISFGSGVTLPTSLAYGGAPFTFTVSSDSGLPVTVGLTPASSPYCSLTGTYPTYTLAVIAAPGLCTLFASVGGTTTFTDVTITQNIPITKGAQTIVFAPLAGKTYGDAAITVNATGGASLNPVTFSSLTTGVCTTSGTYGATVTIVGAGDCTIAADQAGDVNYDAATQVTRTFTVAMAAQTITFGALANKTFGDPAFTVSATGGGSGNAVTFTAGGSCTISGNTVTIAGAGTCTITAAQPGNANYNAATNVPRPFTVASANQTITFGAPGPKTYGAADFLVTASASSGLAVSFSSLTAGTCTVSASMMVHIVATGICTIAADQVGDTNYNAATRVSQSFSIAAATTSTSLTANPTTPVPYGTTINLTAAVTPVTATGNVEFIDATTILSTKSLLAGAATFATSTLAVGTHSLTARYVGDTNDASSTSAALTVTIQEVFKATNPMLQPRVNHTATLLNDGRVLVAGGTMVADDDVRGIGTAEIYCPDPYTPPVTQPNLVLTDWCPNGAGKFSPAGRGNTAQVGIGNMVSARTYHTATLLADGTVLLVGGYDSSDSSTATAEIYDTTNPKLDKFTAVGNLPSKSAGHTATLITKSGTPLVLVTGGGNSSTQLYNPVTKTWSSSGGMSGQRSNHTATLVGTTKVFLAGGVDGSGKTLQTTTIYDIATGTFSSGPTMFAPRERHSAAVLANGNILLAGGRSKSGNSYTVALNALAEIYNPLNATTPFVAAPFASGTGRYSHSASPLLGTNGQPDGRVLIVGGAVGSSCGQQLATSELFVTPAFATGAAMVAGRLAHTATVLKDGRVLVTGGRGATGSTCGTLNTAEIWNGPPSP